MYTFACETKIIYGPGSVSFLKTLGAKRAFLVSDPFFAQNGTADQIAGYASKTFEIFSEIEPDPTVSLVARGTEQLRAFGPDLIVALGGGSAMDAAKAMALAANLDAPLVAIPTTSGSGAEVTDFTILTHQGLKHPLVDPRLRPNYAILDPELLTNLPKSLIADAGFDVLSHALEAVAATGATAISDALASSAFASAFAALPASFAGDVSRRGQVHMSAAMSAMAFSSAGLGLCHALAHALGGAFHIPHGRLNAILLPHVLQVNSSAVRSKYTALARQAGLTAASEAMAFRALLSGLSRLRRELHLPCCLADAGVSVTALRQQEASLAEAACKDPCAKTNPVPVTKELCLELLQAALNRP